MSIVGESVLKENSQGNDVTALQKSLHELSTVFGQPNLDPGAADGQFGPHTKTAVINFQNWYSLVADGVVGPVTWSNLDDSDFSEPTLQDSSHGNAVRRLQRALRAAGSDPGGIDGQFAGKTKAAVQDFQGNVGLSGDGVVGMQTWGLLDRVRA
jgi:peptidoglycan hydrolase-like protein with peptidoglycan-binding domain